MTVNVEKGVFFCFSCDAKGTAIDLIRAMEGIDRDGAMRKAEAILKAAGQEIKHSAPRGRYQRPGEDRAPSSGRRYVPPGRRSA